MRPNIRDDEKHVDKNTSYEKITKVLKLAYVLPDIRSQILCMSAKRGVKLLRPDFNPLRFLSKSGEIDSLFVTRPGWSKLNFEQLDVFTFDAATGVQNVTDKFSEIELGSTSRKGFVPKAASSPQKVLSGWSKNATWVARSGTPQPIRLFEFRNRGDEHGDRSANIAFTSSGPAVGVISKNSVRHIAFDDPSACDEILSSLLDEAVLIVHGLDIQTLAACTKPTDDQIKLPQLPPDLRSADLPAETVDAVLDCIARAAGLILTAKIAELVTGADMAFEAPSGCRKLRIRYADFPASEPAGKPVNLRLNLLATDGTVREEIVCLPSQHDVRRDFALTMERPKAPDYWQEYEINFSRGTVCTSILIENSKIGTWPMISARISIDDLSDPLRTRALNPVAALLKLISCIGRLSSSDAASDTPLNGTERSTSAYCLGWHLFMANRFRDFRDALTNGLMPGMNFGEMTAGSASFNSGLKSKYHRIVSKHGFKKPLYAQNTDIVLGQVNYLEDIFREIDESMLFICYGTLLGCIREKAFIPHDDDIDLAWVLDVTDRSDMLRKRSLMIAELARRENISVKDTYKSGDRVNFSVKIKGMGVGVVLDVFPLWRTPDGHVHGMMESLKIRQLAGDWFKTFQRKAFYDSTVLVPTMAERFLEDRYGPGWIKSDPSYGIRPAKH
jgi:LicD family